MMAEKSTLIQIFTPNVMIDLFASQRALVVGRSYDGAGTVTTIELQGPHVVVTFDRGTAKPAQRMLVSPAGWGWLL